MLHLLKGPELRMHYWEDSEKKKAQHLVVFEPTTSLSLWGLFFTAVQQPLFNSIVLLDSTKSGYKYS